MNWENLPKNATDSQTILEAIDERIADHLGDSEAHLDDDASLETHRAAEVVDHPAESVVNDKIKVNARAYIAIVDPSSEEDFDTIAAAVAYAAPLGGGNILIMPGDHYLSGQVDVPFSINFVGTDWESCKIHGDQSSGDFLNFTEDTVNGQSRVRFENLQLVSDGGAVVRCLNDWFPLFGYFDFDHCIFNGGGPYVQTAVIINTVRDCIVYCGNSGAFQSSHYLYLRDSTFNRYSTSTTPLVHEQLTDYETEVYVRAWGCTFSATGASTPRWFNNSEGGDFQMYFCTMSPARFSDMSPAPSFMMGCQIALASGQDITSSDNTYFSDIINCWITGGNTPAVVIDSANINFFGNRVQNGFSVTNGGSLASMSSPEKLYVVLSGSATAMALGVNITAQLTPNSTRTLTTTVPPPGQKRTLIILTSGTTPYTLTFGSGFKTTGTLSTGSTSARRFVLTFVSDGTQLIEISRTTAIA